MRNWFDCKWLKMHVKISKRREWTSEWVNAEEKLQLLALANIPVDGMHAHTLNKLIENRFLLSMNSTYTHKLDNERKKVELGLCIDSQCTLFVNWLQKRIGAYIYNTLERQTHRKAECVRESESMNAEESAFQLCTSIHFQYQCISLTFIFLCFWLCAVACFVLHCFALLGSMTRVAILIAL